MYLYILVHLVTVMDQTSCSRGDMCWGAQHIYIAKTGAEFVYIENLKTGFLVLFASLLASNLFI